MDLRRNITLSLTLSLASCATLLAQVEMEVDVAPAAPSEAEAPEAPAAPEVSPTELMEIAGYLTAQGGGVPSLQLAEEGHEALAAGLEGQLTGGMDVMSLSRPQVEAALASAQARAEAVQSGAEELPAIPSEALEIVGGVIALQSGLDRLGFTAAEVAMIRDGFVRGAGDDQPDPALEPKMGAFQEFIEARVAVMQAEAEAAQAAAQEAARAQFESIAADWRERPNLDVVLETTQGDVTLELYPSEAPLAVANFVGHIENDYYDGLTFHRVIDGFMIQGGDPAGNGTGGQSIWGANFPDEFSEALRFDEVGMLAMANAGPMTNGSQFFITTSTPAALNDRHTIFGKVTAGYENVEKIESVETDARDQPVEVQQIIDAYVVE